mmetsp:Transcript_6596/g.18691  ORF Transcript_6596/g.18691 Transcript_6596/m.18691 type:complete len:204 (+) Transcript_6596:94-705(+)
MRRHRTRSTFWVRPSSRYPQGWSCRSSATTTSRTGCASCVSPSSSAKTQTGLQAPSRSRSCQVHTILEAPLSWQDNEYRLVVAHSPLVVTVRCSHNGIALFHLRSSVRPPPQRLLDGFSRLALPQKSFLIVSIGHHWMRSSLSPPRIWCRGARCGCWAAQSEFSIVMMSTHKLRRGCCGADCSRRTFNLSRQLQTLIQKCALL